MATAQTEDQSTGVVYSGYMLPFDPSTDSPNRFFLSIGYEAYLIYPWTVTFTNASTIPTLTMVTTTSILGVMPAPFANSVTESGSGLNPTFTWSFPTSVDGVTVTKPKGDKK